MSTGISKENAQCILSEYKDAVDGLIGDLQESYAKMDDGNIKEIEEFCSYIEKIIQECSSLQSKLEGISFS